MRANSTPRSPYPPGRPPVRAGACSVLHVLPSSTDCSTPTAQKVVAAAPATLAGHSLVRAHTLVPMALTSSTYGPISASCQVSPSSWLTHSGAPPVERAPHRYPVEPINSSWPG